MRFETRAHRTFDEAEQRQALDNTDHVEYEITFLRAGTDEPVAVAGYTDVYGFDRPPAPTPLADLLRRFDWSPREDFVVLPVEGWASAPGTADRKALALNAGLGWRESSFALDHVTWAGPLVAVGDRHGDCDYSVDRFNGRTGEQRPVAAPASPIGYRIDSVAGRRIRIRKVLDNCRRAEDLRSFREQCLSLDLDTMVLAPQPCPGP